MLTTESPLQYEIDPPRRQVHVTYLRQPRFDEWESTMETIFQDDRLAAGFGFVLDRREVHRAASTDYIRRMVAFIDARQARFGPSRWAIVVADIASFGTGRMAEQLAEVAAIRTFREMDQALQWLEAGDPG